MKEILLDHIRNLSETKNGDKKMTQVQKTKRKSAKVNVILFSIHSVYTLQTTKYKRQILKQKQGFSKRILSI